MFLIFALEIKDMAVSKHGPKFKAKKKKSNINKQKRREMENIEKEQPKTFVYRKDRQTVEVPIQAWQILNQSAQQLQSIALFVSTMELVGQQHMTDGTLLPVFDRDLEPTGQKNPDGSPQVKIKDSFWEKASPVMAMEKPLIVKADGKTLYDATTPLVDSPSAAWGEMPK